MPEETINGYRMYYEVHGQGQPLVMIHGGLGGGEGCASMSECHAQALGSKYKLILYDRRAAGRSETPESGYSMANQVQDLRSLLRRLDVTRAHVLGSSGGGPIALTLALNYPQMVDTLLLINTMSYASGPERAARQQEMDAFVANEAEYGREGSVERGIEARNPGIRESEPDRFQRLKAINMEKFPGMLASFRAYLDIGGTIESRLSSLDLPTLIAHGDADTTIPVSCAHTLYEMISGAQLEIIPGAVHGIMTNEADRLRDLIVNFIEKAPVAR
ncbi:MAG: hypothetical protein BZY88_09495 [SAR202 cluster bacterium Io17-Chloro-G9]|nr:MAG: hypothetical protein BZY88_09495 [SAR202 cluster bacterium Io17-Chloro-G9]